jgi:DNA-directed RNA polymerase beta' subunit
MNVHIPQSYVTKYELLALTLVPTQIISPANCKPIISIVQDTLVGAYLMTNKEQIINKKEFFNMMFKNPHFNITKFALRNQKTFNGHQAYSTILPDISFGDTIKNGEFVKGVLGKKALGGSAGGLIQTINNMYGSKEAQRFLDSTQNLITRWLENHSFSIGYGDCMISKELQKEIDDYIDSKIAEVEALIKSAQLGLYNEKIDSSLLVDSMEQDMTDKLGLITMKVEELLKDKIDKENNFKIAVESGAKGKDINIRQIVGSVGQQTVWNTRISNGFTERTLPHFFRTDYGPAAKGFVRNSYFKGMTPSELYFHMMAGRTGNIDTAIKTAGTGYISRRLMKAMEDIKIEYDFTVRNANNNIVQFMYGEDSFDPIKLEINLLNVIQFSDKEMEENYKYDAPEDKTYWNTIILPSTVDILMKEPDYVEMLEAEYQKLIDSRDLLRTKYMKNLDVITNNRCYLPINFFRLLPFIKNKFDLTDNNIPDITPTYIIEEVEKLISKCLRYVTQEIGLPYLEIMIRSSLASKQILTVHHYNKLAFDYLILTIHNKVISSFVNYGEMVGPIAAQSIGEPSTQLTLNSIDYEEYILVREGDKVYDIKIGEFIDNIIDNTTDESLIENHPNDTVLRWTKDTNKYRIMSVDEDGHVMFDDIDAVTRHPVVNEDGTDTLVKITTQMGRTVSATKAKSLLIRVDNKIVPTKGSDVKVGDRMPVGMIYPVAPEECLKELDMTRYFPKDQFVYGSEIKKAMECASEEKYWFRKNKGKRFILPYTRSDSVLRADSDTVESRPKYQAMSKQKFLEGCVYPKKCTLTTSELPEKLPLDELTGFFFGAYLAEGCATKTFVCISNNDEDYRNKVYQFLDKYKIGHHTVIKTVVKDEKHKVGGTSSDIKVHSTLMAKLVSDTCKNGSANKVIPDFAYIANLEFVRGLLNGYFSGDGSVVKSGVICSSVSENLIDGLIVLLARFGIFAKKSKPTKVLKNNIGSKNILQGYHIKLSTAESRKFAEHIPLVIRYKQDALDDILQKDISTEYGQENYISGIKISNFEGEMKRDQIDKLLNEDNNSLTDEDINILQNALDMPVFFDKIVKIEEVKPTKKWVYDFTTRLTRNFSSRHQCFFFDTFHLSGTKANVTEGVPRLSEIISVSKDPKKPVMNIFLKEEYSDSMEKANSLAAQLEYTKIGDLVNESNILYDSHTDTSTDEDVEFIKTYYEFNELFELDMKDVEELSNWVLRIIFDKEQMMNKNITMSEIQQAILQNISSDDDIQTIFSDDNSGNLVMRIRVRKDMENDNYIYFLDEFEKSIQNITLRGIPGVSKVFPTESNHVKYNPDSTYVNKKIWMLLSEGSNLIDIMKSDFVDTTRTNSNHITEIWEVLGLEAARNAIIQETDLVFIQSDINYRHIALLADTMTYRGNIMQINRFGVNRSPEYGPIAKASFEEINDVLITSSIFSSKDNMKGTSANITMGQMIKAGTNAFKILLDEDKLIQGLEHPETTENDDHVASVNEVDAEIEEMYDNYDPDLNVDDDDFQFGYQLDDVQEYDLGETPEVLPTLSAEALAIIGEKPKTKKIKIIKENKNNTPTSQGTPPPNVPDETTPYYNDTQLQQNDFSDTLEEPEQEAEPEQDQEQEPEAEAEQEADETPKKKLKKTVAKKVTKKTPIKQVTETKSVKIKIKK